MSTKPTGQREYAAPLGQRVSQTPTRTKTQRYFFTRSLHQHTMFCRANTSQFSLWLTVAR
ncbi:hypothetical protein WN55_04768 [Dufourea novaeangliae]|uniref:Uncharacterized protein n=1 Tax=Dufourea novaeangliae TaxID=178035 RepID=A0A154P3L7_DUFNO|nr:hypothetical protein WN55_04768 [Dufourea novaeangliae]